MNIKDAIKKAEKILPGRQAPEGEEDPRWKAIINIGIFIESNPEEVWAFTLRWGKHKNRDIRSAISTILLEHLLEHHFEIIFPRVEKAVKTNKLFADTFQGCWKFGKSKRGINSKRFDMLLKYCAS